MPREKFGDELNVFCWACSANDVSTLSGRSTCVLHTSVIRYEAARRGTSRLFRPLEQAEHDDFFNLLCALNSAEGHVLMAIARHYFSGKTSGASRLVELQTAGSLPDTHLHSFESRGQVYGYFIASDTDGSLRWYDEETGWDSLGEERLLFAACPTCHGRHDNPTISVACTQCTALVSLEEARDRLHLLIDEGKLDDLLLLERYANLLKTSTLVRR